MVGGACGSSVIGSGFTISRTWSIGTAYDTSPTTKPTRLFCGSGRSGRKIISAKLAGQDGAQVEQHHETTGRPGDADDVLGGVAAERAGRGFDLGSLQA